MYVPTPLAVPGVFHVSPSEPSRPDSASLGVNTGLLGRAVAPPQKLYEAALLSVMPRFGAVLSMLMLSFVALALLPALSKTVRVTDWFAPSPESVTSPGHAATPDAVPPCTGS